MNSFKMIVDGFLFTDEKSARKACQEQDSIRYVRDRLDMENPRMVAEMYHKMISGHVFETPVGLMYLKELQDYLRAVPEAEKTRIAAIPVPGRNPSIQSDAQAVDGGAQDNGRRQAVQPAVPQEMADREAAVDQETMDWYAQKLEESRQHERQAQYRMRRAEERARMSRSRLRISLFVSIFLILVSVGFGIITMTDNHPNILNYENKIIEKYENWEEDLAAREQALKEKESE